MCFAACPGPTRIQGAAGRGASSAANLAGAEVAVVGGGRRCLLDRAIVVGTRVDVLGDLVRLVCWGVFFDALRRRGMSGGGDRITKMGK